MTMTNRPEQPRTPNRQTETEAPTPSQMSAKLPPHADRPDLALLRVRLDADTSLGPGKADILEGIAKAGSIAAAGRRMKMSYKRAWSLVETLNSDFAEPLVASSRGRRKGRRRGADPDRRGCARPLSRAGGRRRSGHRARSEIAAGPDARACRTATRGVRSGPRKNIRYVGRKITLPGLGRLGYVISSKTYRRQP